MRDIRKALDSASSKIKIYGPLNFLIKVLEIAVSELLTKKKFKLKKGSKLHPPRLDFLEAFIESSVKSSDSERIDLLLSSYFKHNYVVYDHFLNLNSDILLGSTLANLSDVLSSFELKALTEIYGGEKNTDWNKDPINDYRFVLKEIPYNIAEIKIPWEIGRFNLFPQLALWSTNVNKVKFLFEREVLSFYSQNYITDNIQWCNAMEAGIRIHNMILTYCILHSKGVDFTLGFNSVFSAGLTQHERFIFFHNEYSMVQTSNHFACNLLGLAAINRFKPSKLKARCLKKLLISEIKRNTRGGFLTEGSTAYHRFTSEIYVSTLLMISADDFKNRPDVLSTLCDMGKVVEAIENPLGLHTQFGDSDGGFLNWLVLPYSQKLGVYSPYSVNNYRVFMLAFKNYMKLDDSNELHLGMTKFGAGAIWVYKQKGVYLAINNIEPTDSVFNKTHYHDDHGYVELFIDENAIQVDAGMPCYTLDSQRRIYYQSNSSHYNNLETFKLDNPFADITRAFNTLSFYSCGSIDNILVSTENGKKLFNFEYNTITHFLSYELSGSKGVPYLYPNYLAPPLNLT